jgi:RNA-directed DNA polymerase
MDAELTIESVFDAYFECRKTKRNTINQLRFEVDLERNLVSLYHDLANGTYTIGRSVAFVVTYPKIREVWAADFRDRIVHHVIYRAIFDRFHNRFIRDSYACIPGRGTHDGLRRVSGFARSVTENWSKPAYFLKADVANFFNSIDRKLLMGLFERQVPEKWLLDLMRQVAMHDPRQSGILRSPQHLFDKVPRHKSLLHAADGIGLPIGNLTSQFFANLYLNELDQFAKHVLKAKYYGRYVDDMVLFHEDPAVLNDWYRRMDDFLFEKLALRFHPNKKHINHANTGIDFVGFIIKPYRNYLRQSTLANCKRKIGTWERDGAAVDNEALQNLSESVTSYLGMLRQVDGYNARKSLCGRVGNLFIRADKDYTKLTVPLK